MVPVPAVLIKKTVKRNDQATTPTDNTPDILPLHPMPGYRGEDSNGLNGFPPPVFQMPSATTDPGPAKGLKVFLDEPQNGHCQLSGISLKVVPEGVLVFGSPLSGS